MFVPKLSIINRIVIVSGLLVGGGLLFAYSCYPGNLEERSIDFTTGCISIGTSFRLMRGGA